MRVKIGIYGMGRFGSTLAKLLIDRELYLYDINKELSNCSKEQVLASDIIFYCVPISLLEAVIIDNKEIISPDSIIVDTCSVKEYPKNIITKNLPNHSYIATHPLFGPDSAFIKDAKLEWIYENVNATVKHLDSFIKLISNSKGILKEMSCTEHDRNIASKQFLTHSIGRILDDMDIEYEEYSTVGYKALVKVSEQTTNDSFALYLDMFKYNRFAKDVINNISKSVENIKDRLE